MLRTAVAETCTPSRSNSLDALVAPARVLPGQADNQLLQLLTDWRSSRSTRASPHASNQPPVPAQQRLWPDEEARPAGSGQRPTDRCQQGPVGGLEPWTWDLAAQHAKLVALHEDLQVPGGVPRASIASSWMERQSVR